MSRGRRLSAGVLVVCGALLPAAPAPGATDPLAATARLEGNFSLAGRITTAVGVHGEHRGQGVQRTWGFASTCATGACGTVGLLRQRGHGYDSVVLHRRHAGYYTATGSFFVPLRCGGRTYARGEKVPFTVSVQVTGGAVAGGVVVATRINTTYVSHGRRNLTPCVVAPAREAASFHGHLVALPATAAPARAGSSGGGV